MATGDATRIGQLHGKRPNIAVNVSLLRKFLQANNAAHSLRQLPFNPLFRACDYLAQDITFQACNSLNRRKARLH